MDVFANVYRSAIAVTPQMPFWEWLNTIDLSVSVTLEELQADAHIYLVPDFEDEPDIEKAMDEFLQDNFEHIFVNELSGWWLDEAVYPEISYPLFLEWFTYKKHSMIFDMLDEELEKEES